MEKINQDSKIIYESLNFSIEEQVQSMVPFFVVMFRSRYSSACESEEIYFNVIECYPSTMGKHSVNSKLFLGLILTTLPQQCHPVIQPHVLLIQITMHMHGHMFHPCGPPQSHHLVQYQHSHPLLCNSTRCVRLIAPLTTPQENCCYQEGYAVDWDV